MAVSRIDWVVMWKLYHYQFFWIYLALGVPLRLILAGGFKPVLANKTSLYASVSSLASSLLSTWFPIVPIISGAVLMAAAGDLAGQAAGESLLFGVPLVAVSMAIETAFVDALLFRLFLKASVDRRFMTLFITNIMNAALALALALAWAFHHLPIFIAALDS